MTSNSESGSLTTLGDRRTVYGDSIVLGLALYFGLQAVGYPLWGVAALVTGFGGAIALALTSTRPMWDERYEEIHRRTAGRTVALFGWLAAIAFPTVVALEALGRLAFPSWLGPIAAAVTVFYLACGGFQTYDRFVAIP
jgi:hypothetical protein